MAAICPDFKWSGVLISDPIRNPDHLQTDLSLNNQNLDMPRFKNPTALLLLCCFDVQLTFYIYNNHLNTGQVWYSNGPNMSHCQMVWFLNGLWKLDKKYMFYGLKCLVFEWLAQSPDTPFENPAKKCLKSLMFGFRVFGIQKVSVQHFDLDTKALNIGTWGSE